MSLITLNSSSISMSVSDTDRELKKKILDCLGATVDEDEDEVLGGIEDLPDSLEELNDIPFLEADGYLRHDKEEDLFLLLKMLFGDTYLLVADEWDYEETDDDDDDEDNDEDDYDDEDEEGGEDNGTKAVTLYVPEESKKCTFVISIHEVFDLGGGSNGADIEFVEAEGIEEKSIDKVMPNESFVKEICEKAKEKGYTDLANLIIEKIA